MIYVISPICKPNFINNVVNNFKRQHHLDKKLIVVENGPAIGCSKKHSSIDYVLTSDPDMASAKNEAINFIKNKGGGLWTSFDDDDVYEENYLDEVVDNFKDGFVLGKVSMFCKIDNGDIILLDNIYENSECNEVIGCTQTAHTSYDLFYTKAPYSLEDHLFIVDAKNKGLKIYTTSKFNMIYNRSGSNHLMKVSNNSFLNRWKIKYPEIVVKNYGKVLGNTREIYQMPYEEVKLKSIEDMWIEDITS